MESRPNYLLSETITAENYKTHIATIEGALALKPGSLNAVLDTDQLKEKLSALHEHRRLIIDAIDIAMIEVTDSSGENNPAVIEFQQNKHDELATKLAAIHATFLAPAEEVLHAHLKQTKATLEKLLDKDKCNAGNLSLAVTTFKKNIVIALQIAADTLAHNGRALNRVQHFNSIFKNVSMLNHQHGIYHHTSAPHDYSELDLNEWQKMLGNLLADCDKYNETVIRETIINELLSLNNVANHPLFHAKQLVTVKNNTLTFTPELHAAETRALHTHTEAKKLVSALEKSAQQAIEAFHETDHEAFTAQTGLMHEAINAANNEIHAFKSNPGKIEKTTESFAPESTTPLIEESAAPAYKRSSTAPVISAASPPDQPETKSFWQRHKRVIVGLLIGLAVVAATAIVIGAIVASGGAAAAAIAGFGVGMVATCGIGGTVALCVTAAAAVCATGAAMGLVSKKVEERQRAPKRQLSSTAGAFQTLGVTEESIDASAPPAKRLNTKSNRATVVAATPAAQLSTETAANYFTIR